MQEVIEAIENLIDFFVQIFRFIGNIFTSIALAFSYILQMTGKIYQVVATLPVWLQSFAFITIGVSIAYFIIGRKAGTTK